MLAGNTGAATVQGTNMYQRARAVSTSTSNMAIQAVMDREGKDLRRSREEIPDGLPPLEPAQAGAFPKRLFSEQHRDPVGVVLAVAHRGIARFQVADRLRVLQDL